MKKDLFKQILEDSKRFGDKMMTAPTTSEKQSLQEMNMREMLRRMRKNKVQEELAQPQQQQAAVPHQPSERQITPMEQKRYEERMNNYFQNDNVTIEFSDLLIYDNGIFWAGTIDGQLQFVYKVTPDEQSSGVEINYLDGFNKNDPDNAKIVDKVNAYYDEFYKYWRENELEVDN